MSDTNSFIGDLLVKRGAITDEKLKNIMQRQGGRKGSVVRAVLSSNEAAEDDVLEAMAKEAGLTIIENINADEVPAELVDTLPITFARQHTVLPVVERNGIVRIATADPFDHETWDDLRTLFGKPIEPVACKADIIEDAINRVYERNAESSLDEVDEQDEEEELQDLIDMTDEAPVIRWVNNLFYTAVRDRASDIHIEPTDTDVSVRYRIDGKLVPKKSAHRGFLPSIVSRVKIEAGLNIAEKRLPQDGRITKKIAGKLVDVRVSTVPTAKGERIVMRLLDKQQALLDLPQLGFDTRELTTMEDLIRRPNGIILVTGPTGSGKTTTLYACLNKINDPERNILTAEDPVEYELRGVGQVQVMPKIGLTFASGLRSFLRQDPDVIMVGEIRDHETAEIAIHASLTGHLVLSTLHTNDAPTAITRLVDMGIQSFQISSSLIGVLAQRLVRKLCFACREPYRPTAEDIRELGLDAADPNVFSRITGVTESGRPAPSFYRARGCDECTGTGYRGRIGIYELMTINEPIRREILNNSDSSTIMRVACEYGMRSLREDGARKVVAGLTSADEVLAATQAGEMD